jgi:DNA-directed RNA polymerase specialized sigma24 family protein
MRILGGASMEDIAEVMGVTRQTVHKHWKVGQAWLVVCLKRDGRRN